jgi:hypothetical protein
MLLVGMVEVVGCQDEVLESQERDCQIICESIWRPCDEPGQDYGVKIANECTAACVESLAEMPVECFFAADETLDCVAGIQDCTAVHAYCWTLLHNYDGLCIGIELY